MSDFGREIGQMTEEQCIAKLESGEVQPNTAGAMAYHARLQQLLLTKLADQTRKLLDVATAQKLLAEKLDRMTRWLVMLTAGLFALTVVLIILTIKLITHEDYKTQSNLAVTPTSGPVIQTNTKPPKIPASP